MQTFCVPDGDEGERKWQRKRRTHGNIDGKKKNKPY